MFRLNHCSQQYWCKIEIGKPKYGQWADDTMALHILSTNRDTINVKRKKNESRLEKYTISRCLLNNIDGERRQCFCMLENKQM